MTAYRLICPGLHGDPRPCGNDPEPGHKLCHRCMVELDMRLRAVRASAEEGKRP